MGVSQRRLWAILLCPSQSKEVMGSVVPHQTRGQHHGVAAVGRDLWPTCSIGDIHGALPGVGGGFQRPPGGIPPLWDPHPRLSQHRGRCAAQCLQAVRGVGQQVTVPEKQVCPNFKGICIRSDKEAII